MCSSDLIWANPGTAWQYPGTGWQNSASTSRVLGKRSRNQDSASQILDQGQRIIEEIMAVDPVEPNEHLFPLHPVPEWAQQIMSFMSDDTLPSDETESRRIQRRSKGYTIINKELYKRSTTEVLQRCVDPVEGKEMLLEIHQGECGHHCSTRALVAKVFRHGFYWPTAHADAEDIVRK